MLFPIDTMLYGLLRRYDRFVDIVLVSVDSMLSSSMRRLRPRNAKGTKRFACKPGFGTAIRNTRSLPNLTNNCLSLGLHRGAPMTGMILPSRSKRISAEYDIGVSLAVDTTGFVFRTGYSSIRLPSTSSSVRSPLSPRRIIFQEEVISIRSSSRRRSSAACRYDSLIRSGALLVDTQLSVWPRRCLGDR